MKRNWLKVHKKVFQNSLVVVLSGLMIIGCGDSDSTQLTHEHADSEYGQDHNHYLGKSLHGGSILPIGHTHIKDEATHFHAEIMPLRESTIRFHLVSVSDKSGSADYPIASNEIPAMISIKGRETVAIECSFSATGKVDDISSEFSLTIPEAIIEGETFLVVVPRLALGDEPQNFSFTLSRRNLTVDHEPMESDTSKSSKETAEINESLEDQLND